MQHYLVLLFVIVMHISHLISSGKMSNNISEKINFKELSLLFILISLMVLFLIGV